MHQGHFSCPYPIQPESRETRPDGGDFYHVRFEGAQYLRLDLAQPRTDVIGIEAHARIRLHPRFYSEGKFSFLVMFNEVSTFWSGFPVVPGT